MTVIVANNTPDSIRGMLKRWLIEPRPNVFVGTLNGRTHDKTLDYIKRNSRDFGMLIISSAPNCQGYTITTTGDAKRKEADFSGLKLIAEQWVATEDRPF